jgi:ribonuclease E
VEKRMLINVTEEEEYRIAVVEDGVLEELYIERTRAERHVGDIYLARVQNVEPSIQAAFVELGTEKNGFLHVSDIRPDVSDIPPTKTPSQRSRKKKRDDIRSMLKKGDRVLVQVTRGPIDDKGPSVTTYVSLPGRYLVMMPGLSHHGVSRKIQDEDARKRLKSLLGEMDVPKQAGFIIRTAGMGQTKRDLQRDLKYLERLWGAVCKKLKDAKPPALVYQESDLIIRCMRDLFTSDTDEIIIDDEDVSKRVREFLAMVSPAYKKRVRLYKGKSPLFTKFKIDDAVDEVCEPRVTLAHGGSLVIEQTEALVAIDVNSGKYTEETDAEKTAYRTNMDAAPEIARQLRLRDLGGVVVIDFIDMKSAKHRREVEKALYDAMRRDKARSKILRTSQFGLVQMTRQRMRPSVARALFTKCPVCEGTGRVRTLESITVDLLRELRLAVTRKKLDTVECTLHPSAALHVLNEKRGRLREMEGKWKTGIRVKADSNLQMQEFELLGFKGKKTIKL